jgi:hypothetical protein
MKKNKRELEFTGEAASEELKKEEEIIKEVN